MRKSAEEKFCFRVYSDGTAPFFARRTSFGPPLGFLDIAERPAVVFHHDKRGDIHRAMEIGKSNILSHKRIASLFFLLPDDFVKT